MVNYISRLISEEEGWTFVETLIVIGIVVILTGSVGFMGMKYLERAKVVSARSEIQALSMAIDSYYLDNGQYPSEDQGLKSLWQKPHLEPVPDNWVGPYVNKNDFEDPWKYEYIYEVPGESGLPYSIVSYGSDGFAGGEGNAKDIKSWEG